MVPAPMRPVQTLLIVIASFLVAGALWPWDERRRVICAGAAVALVVGVLLMRLRAHRATATVDSDTRSVAQRIRADRAARMARRR